MSYYDLLEISENASEEVIRVAYKALAKKYHPDVYQGDHEFAEQQMKEINAAYEVLIDPKKRATYDETIKGHTHSAKNASYNTTKQQTPSSAKKNNSSNTKTSVVRVPFLFQWKIVFLVLTISCIFENSLLFYFGLFLFVIRLLAGLRNKKYRLHGLKKCYAFVFCSFALLLSFSIFFLDTSPHSSTSHISPAASTAPVIPSNPSDTTNHDSAAPTGSAVHVDPTASQTSKENSPDIAAPNTDNHTQNKPESTEYKPPQFSKPTVLGDRNITYVWSIVDDQALLSVKEDKETVTKYYNLTYGTELRDDSILKTLATLSENMYYDLDQGDTLIYEGASSPNQEFNKNLAIIDTVLKEREAYVIKRNVTTLEFSGFEYALISFDGKILTDWIREPSSSEHWHHLGDGMFNAGYLVDMLTGEIFPSPDIEYLSEEEFYHCHRSDGGFFLEGESGYQGNESIVYLQLAQYGNFPLIFYSVNRQGQYKEISRLPAADNVQYIDALDMYICVSYSNGTVDTYGKFMIYDMFGNVLLDFRDTEISDFELGNTYITIAQKNKSGSIESTFYSFYDYRGNEIHAPFSTAGKEIILLEEIDSYALVENNILQIYDMADTFLFKLEPTKVMEKAFIGKKERTYYPTNIQAYDSGYYVIECFEPDTNQVRYFIGKVKCHGTFVSTLNIPDATDQPQKNIAIIPSEILPDASTSDSANTQTQNNGTIDNMPESLVVQNGLQYGTELCGYDYHGNKLYIGHLVRIGIDSSGTQYACGTIVGYLDEGYVQVKFTDVLPTEGSTHVDYFYLNGIAEEIATYGESVQFIDSCTLQICN